MPINRIKGADGRACWQFEFSRRIEGQRVRVRKSLPPSWTRAQADAFDRTECARLYAEATGTSKPQFLIEQAVARYLVERVPELKHGKAQAAEMDLMEAYWRGHTLEQLPSVCAQYLKDHRATLAPATVKNRLRYLVSACRWSWKHHRMCEHDPGAGVVYPAVSNARQVYIERKQMIELARACEHRPTRAAIRIAFYSGMRASEIRHAARDFTAGAFVLHDTKNGEPRIVPMHPKVRACSRIAIPANIRPYFDAARDKAGMGWLRFHDLRHSAASAMINSGVDLYTVGAVLGHKSHASTKRYAHKSTRSLAAAVASIGKKAA